MTTTTQPHSITRTALTAHLAACIEFVEAEIAQMNDTVTRLEKPPRQRILNTYNEGEWWRALAAPPFVRMADALTVLRDGVAPAAVTEAPASESL